MNRIRILIIGGDKEGYHNFSILGPIYNNFLTNKGFEVELSEDLNMLLPQNIRDFDIILCCTLNASLTNEQAKGLIDSVTGNPWGDTGKPKGFIGVHGASCSFLEHPDYLRMLGGKFLTHPPMGEIYTFKIKNPTHPVTSGLNDFEMIDELYLLETYPPFETLIACEYAGFERPVAWVKPYGLGRVFYTALGHGKEQTENPVFQTVIGNAAAWCAQIS